MNTQKPSGNGKTTCLVCGSATIYKRGLCNGHYHKFNRAKEKARTSGFDVKAFEQEFVDAGLLLPDQRTPSDNPFMDLLNEQLKEHKRKAREVVSDSIAKKLDKKTKR